jgi:hypothetical protein
MVSMCLSKAVQTFKNRFNSIRQTLQYFCDFGKPRERVEAKGLLTQLMSPATIFMLHLFYELLSLTNCVSNYCQDRNANMSAACTLVKSTIASLESMRNDVNFDRIYAFVVAMCLELGITIQSEESSEQVQSAPTTSVLSSRKRNSSLPQNFRDSLILTTLGRREVVVPSAGTNDSTSSAPLSAKLTLKKHMFDIVDNMKEELSRRFGDIEPLLVSCDTVNPKSPLFLDFDAMRPLAEAFAYLGIDREKLKAQAIVAKNMFESNSKASSPDTVLKLLTDMKFAFPDLVLFTKLVLTIPVSSAGAERSFSAMKRVKTYLRSTMADNRLNNLCLISIERALSADLVKDPSSVVDTFSRKGKRRLTLQ